MTDEASFQIVPCEPLYEEDVRSLAEEILCREYGVQEDISGEDDLRDIDRSYPPPHSRFLLAVMDGQVLATGGVRRVSETDCELRRLYVRASHRRQGFASAVVGNLLRFVREQGYERILLELRPEMEDTVERYGRYGFVPVAEGEDLPRPGRFMAIHL